MDDDLDNIKPEFDQEKEPNQNQTPETTANIVNTAITAVKSITLLDIKTNFLDIFNLIYNLGNTIDKDKDGNPIPISGQIGNKFMLIINIFIEICLLPKKLLMFAIPVFGRQYLKNSIITLFFLIICLILYSIIESMFIEEHQKCANGASKPSNYIQEQWDEFYKQTLKLLNSEYNILSKNKNKKTYQDNQDKNNPENQNIPPKYKQSSNFEIIITQLLGWIALLWAIVIISNPTNNETKITLKNGKIEGDPIPIFN